VRRDRRRGVPLCKHTTHTIIQGLSHPPLRTGKAAPTRGAGACSAACPTARRTCTRAPSCGTAITPTRGAAGMQCSSQQHGVPVRVLLHAAHRAPRKAAPTRGAAGMQCSMPSSTAYPYACSFKRPARAALSCPYTAGTWSHRASATQSQARRCGSSGGASRAAGSGCCIGIGSCSGRSSAAAAAAAQRRGECRGEGGRGEGNGRRRGGWVVEAAASPCRFGNIIQLPTHQSSGAGSFMP
jgi:hypothetical protein